MTAAGSLARRKHLHLQTERRARLTRMACYDPDAEWTFRVTLPHPRVLAAAWAVPHLREQGQEVYGRPGAQTLLMRPAGSGVDPQPIDPETLAPVLRQALAALPENREGGTSEAYRNVRRAALHGDASQMDQYLVAVLQAARSDAPRWIPPEQRPTPRTRPPALSAAARQRIHRAGLSDRHAATAGFALAEYLEERLQDESPEEFVLASVLWREATSIASGLQGSEDVPLVPLGRNGFLQIADEILGQRRRRATGAGYVVPGGNGLLIALSDAEDLADDAIERAQRSIAAARAAERSAAPKATERRSAEAGAARPSR